MVLCRQFKQHLVLVLACERTGAECLPSSLSHLRGRLYVFILYRNAILHVFSNVNEIKIFFDSEKLSFQDTVTKLENLFIVLATSAPG